MPGTKVNEVKKEVSPIRKEYNRMKCKESSSERTLGVLKGLIDKVRDQVEHSINQSASGHTADTRCRASKSPEATI